ncbi:MAG: alpha/beta fold hydrolase [Nocardioidaceae bacterium]|nr:alpha/beta fold hydrolase [Nocardioidaceae bacterium]MCL2613264.1 alpha/beta fold hydrolase [Nocardioidaceae bacterium]
MTDANTEPTKVSVGRDGLVFDVLDAGPRGGEVVVLLHGFPERATCWRYVAPILNQAGYRTLAMDQRGYSPAARPTRRREYQVTELSLDVVAMVDQLVGPDATVHVVGHDWGAMVAWALARHHADRIRTLTAVSVPHPQAFLASMPHGQILKSWYMGFFQLPLLPELSATRSGVFDRLLRRAGMDRDDVRRVRAEVVDDGALRTAINWYRALPLSDPRAIRGNVGVPTTYVWSDGDTALGRWGAEHTGEYVHADYRFVELPGVSHWIPTHAPDPLAAAILERVRG